MLRPGPGCCPVAERHAEGGLHRSPRQSRPPTKACAPMRDKLVHGRTAADDDIVANLDVTRQHHIVGEYDAIADLAVMRDMALRQKPAAIARLRQQAAALWCPDAWSRPPGSRNRLRPRVRETSPRNFISCGGWPRAAEGIDLRTRADRGVSGHHDMRVEDHAPSPRTACSPTIPERDPLKRPQQG